MPSPTLDDEVAFISGVNADGALAGKSFYAWNFGTYPATYSGTTEAMKWGADTAGTSGGTIDYYFDPASNWTDAEKQVFVVGLSLWSAEANIQFALTTDAPAAQITFVRGHDGSAYTDPVFAEPTAGQGVTGGSELLTMTSATISIDTSVNGFGPLDGSFYTSGGYAWMTVLHEEGHALGLGHAGPYNENSEGTGIRDAEKDQFSDYDSLQWSLMSYITPDDPTAPYNLDEIDPNSGSPFSWGNFVPTTPMSADILAAQQLYGLPVNTPLSGGQVFGYNTNITGPVAQFFDFTTHIRTPLTLWDAGTGNTLDLSGMDDASSSIMINLNPGSYSSLDNNTRNTLFIAPGTRIDTYRGSPGRDIVTGNNDGNTLYGGGGSDFLNGGSGDDILESDSNLNYLNGGGGIDTAVYLGKRSAYTVTISGKVVTVTGPNQINDTLTQVERLQFADQVMAIPRPAVQNDFNNDGMSDLLWQNSDGTIAEWLLNGTAIAGGNTAGNPGASWKAIASGDFNGDAKSDILWQNADGALAIWLMNGTSVIGGGVLANPGTGWTVLDAGDLDGNGKSDILWQASDGTIAVWLMDGANVTGGGVIANPGSGWSFLSASDFYNNGNADILFQNSAGSVAIWPMFGTHIGGGGVTGGPGGDWSFRAAGDFNGDGQSDILWQNSSGQVAIWLMNGTSVIGGGILDSDPGPSWTAKDVLDVNGDGMADIVWQNSNGQAAVWLMNGTTVTGGGLVGTSPGTSWHLVTS